ncbi:MAG: methylmalonyl Co-A mutase-associated GTPase MeaB [Pseudomonadota bacterium]
MAEPATALAGATGAADADAVLAAIIAGGKAALARALARIEVRAAEPGTAALLDAALSRQRATVIGLTGPPGVGKSTLTDALIAHWRALGQRVGVIAVDPSSRISGGALLGDRTRIRRDPGDDGVFVRSMAARDRLGGIAEQTFPALVLMGAVFDRLIVETVGVGQSETEIAGVVDAVLFCAQPGAGDAVQAMKAGVLEIPDVIAVTKADTGAVAQRTLSDLRSALGAMPRLAGRAPVEVMAVSAVAGTGIGALVAAVEGCAATDDARRIARRHQQAAGWVRLAVGAETGRWGVGVFESRAGDRDQAHPFTNGAVFLDALKSRLDKI